MAKIGLQLYSIRQDTEKDLIGVIQKVADLGYQGVQFAGFFDQSAKEIKTVLDRKGITPAGSHTGIHLFADDQLKQTLEYNEQIGNRLLIVPGLPLDMRQTADDYNERPKC